jgi:hypothetical protein
MIGMMLAKSLYALPTWTRTAALVREHPALAVVIAPDGQVPSVYACYRFTAKLRDHADLLQGCITEVVKALKKRNPVLGWDVAIDASDMPVYANGQRYRYKGGPEREKFSDPDASWGHRSAVSTRKGGGFYGYRIHMAVCAKTDLPLAWRVETASAQESPFVGSLLMALPDRRVPARIRVGQGRQAPSADTARDAAVEGPLPGPRIRRACVRPLQERMGPRTPPGSQDRACAPPCRPDAQLTSALNRERAVALAA